MSVRNRIETIRLIEKMEQNKAYSKKLGICDVSKLHGESVVKGMDLKEVHHEQLR